MARWNVLARSAQVGALLAAIIPCAGATSAAAEVRITYQGGDQLLIEVRDATVQQVLEALGQTRTIQLHSSEALSRPVTGTYAGALRHVLARILDGYDRVIRSTASGIQVDVVGTSQSGNGTASAGPTTTASAALTGPRVVPRLSGNVDADRIKTASPRVPQAANLTSGPHPGAPPAIQPPHATPMGNASRPPALMSLTGPSIR